MKSLSKAQLIVTLVMSVVGPGVSGLSAYYTAQADVNDRLHEVRLETEREFAKKADMGAIADKLDVIAQRLANIEGYLRRGK